MGQLVHLPRFVRQPVLGSVLWDAPLQLVTIRLLICCGTYLWYSSSGGAYPPPPLV